MPGGDFGFLNFEILGGKRKTGMYMNCHIITAAIGLGI